MNEKFERLVVQILKECAEDGEPVTREEAEEMAKMELGAKEISNYVLSTTEKKTIKPREKKIDDVKVHIIKMLKGFIEGMAVTDNISFVAIKNEQKEIVFKIGSDEYSVTLTKHRPKK